MSNLNSKLDLEITSSIKLNMNPTNKFLKDNFLEIEENIYIYTRNNTLFDNEDFKNAFPNGIHSVDTLYNGIMNRMDVLEFMFENEDFNGFMEVMKLSDNGLFDILINDYFYNTYEKFLSKKLEFKRETVNCPYNDNENVEIIVFDFHYKYTENILDTLFYIGSTTFEVSINGTQYNDITDFHENEYETDIKCLISSFIEYLEHSCKYSFIELKNIKNTLTEKYPTLFI